jgi:hypothetical protein
VGVEMAKWSDAIKLGEYLYFRDELEGKSGVYEIGYVKKGEFHAKYNGKAKCLLQRISSYNSENCHNHYIYELHVRAERKMLYFHYFYTNDFEATESRLLHRHGVGVDGLYRFNQKLENAHLREGYSRETALKTVNEAHCGKSCRKSCPRRPNQ